ncbi:MAG: GTP-binding protein, partial [Clostridia bacterium]
MIKIDIISGFLGAGKTTLIKKLVSESLQGVKLAIIENEFGEIGIDSGFLKSSGVEIKELDSGCICCSLVGDFETSLKEVVETYHPERIIIEPSGVGKLSDVAKAVGAVQSEINGVLNNKIVVVDVTKCKIYSKNFGEFFIDQVVSADTIILSRMDKASDKKIKESIALLTELNSTATIITTPITDLSGEVLLESIDNKPDLLNQLIKEVSHHEHHHEHGESCGCGHEHHEHHHEHGESCGCGHEHHEH